MHGAPWIEVRPIRHDRDDDTTGFGLDNVVVQGLRDGVKLTGSEDDDERQDLWDDEP